jgi:invasion protein IalB
MTRKHHNLIQQAFLGLVVPTVLLAAQVATAATPAATPAAGPTTPERTVSTFGDWSLTCNQIGTAPRICEVDSSVQDQQHQTIAAIAIGRTSKDVPQRLVLQVPANVRVSLPLRLTIDTADAVSLPFINCNRLGCFAALEMKDDAVLKRLRNRPTDSNGKIEWADSTGATATLPLSTRGFAAALDALAASETASKPQ